MPGDMGVEHAERIAVLETKVDALQTTLNAAVGQLQDIHNMVQQGKGASRLIAWGSLFFGVGTATLIYAKWSLFLAWMGK